jgi:DNA excision repair protein ERCC-3
MVCDALKRLHEARGDKIIIFCNHIFSLKEYAIRLKIPFICGEVDDKERMSIIAHFRDGIEINTIILLKENNTFYRLIKITLWDTKAS